MTRSEMCEHELARLEQLARGRSLHVAEWQAVVRTLRELLHAEGPLDADRARKRQRVDELEVELHAAAQLLLPQAAAAAA